MQWTKYFHGLRTLIRILRVQFLLSRMKADYQNRARRLFGDVSGDASKQSST